MADKGKWEKDRRKRLNDAFDRLNKVLPSYDPSTNLAKIDIIDKAAEVIIDLNEKLKKALTSEDKENTKDEVLLKFESRLKKLLLRNEFLSNLLKDARIKVPNGYGFVKKRLPKWSNRVTSEQVKVLQKKALEKEITDIPTKPIKRKKNNENSKPKNAQLSYVDKKRKRRKLGFNSKCVIIISQAAGVNNPFYVVPNNEVSHTKTAVSQSSVLRVPLGSAINPPSLGPNALVFPNGSLVPINQPPIPQPTLIANPMQNNGTSTIIIVSKPNANDSSTKGNLHPLNLQNGSLIPINQSAIRQPTLIGNTNQNNSTSTLIIVSKPNLSNDGKSFVTPLPIVTIPQFITDLSNHVFQSACNQWPRIRPKFCSTITTQVNKLPIPALTSKYNNYVYVHTVKPSVKEFPKGKETKNKGEEKKETIKRKRVQGVKQKAKKLKNNIDACTGDKENKKNECKDSTNICQSKNCVSQSVCDIVCDHGENSKAESTQALDKQDNNQSIDQAKVIMALDNKDNEEKLNKQNVLNVNEIILEENIAVPNNINPPPEIVEPMKTSTNNCKEENVKNQKPNELDLTASHSELSNDIFASLNVPPGCQNPDSTSPTAAFLMAFPLVTSGTKASEVVDSDNNDNSQRETPNLLQIGTMDEPKPTQSQSQSESTTPNLFNFESLSFFSQNTQFGLTSSVPALSTSLSSNIFSNSYTSKLGIFDDLFYNQAVSSLSSYGGNISSAKPVPTTNYQSNSVCNNGLSKISDTQVEAAKSKASNTKSVLTSSHNSNAQSGRELISAYKQVVASTSVDSSTNIVFSNSISTTTQSNSIDSNSKSLIKNSHAVVFTSNNLFSTDFISVPKYIFSPKSTSHTNAGAVAIIPTNNTNLLNLQSEHIPNPQVISSVSEFAPNSASSQQNQMRISRNEIITSQTSQSEQGQQILNPQISNTSKCFSNLATAQQNQMNINKNENITSQNINKPTVKPHPEQPQTNMVSTSIESTKSSENIQFHSTIGDSNAASTVKSRETVSSKVSTVLPFVSTSSTKNVTTVAGNKNNDHFPISIYGNLVTNSFNSGPKIDMLNTSNTQGPKHDKTFSEGNFGYYLPYENVYDHNRKTNFALDKKDVKPNNALSNLSMPQNTCDSNIFKSSRYLNAASVNKLKEIVNEGSAEAMSNLNNQHDLLINRNTEAQNILNQQVTNTEKPKQNTLLTQINDKSFNSFKESKTLYNESCKDIFNCTQTKTQESATSKSSKLLEHNSQPNFFQNNTERDLYPVCSEKMSSNSSYYRIQPPNIPSEKISQTSLLNTNQKTHFSTEYLNAYNVKSDSNIITNQNVTSQNFNFSLYPQKADKFNVGSSSTYNNLKLSYDAEVNLNSNIHVNRKLFHETTNNKNESSMNPNPEHNNSRHSSTHQTHYTGIQNYKPNPYFTNSKQTTKTSKSNPDFIFNSNQGVRSEQFSLNSYSGEHKKTNESNPQAIISNITHVKTDTTGNSKQNPGTGNFNFHHSNIKNPQNKSVDNNLKLKLDSAGDSNQNMGPNNFNFDLYSLDAKKKNDVNSYNNLKYNKSNSFDFSNQNPTNFYTQVNSANSSKDKNVGLNSNQNIAKQNFNFNPYLNTDMKKKHDQNIQVQQKPLYLNKSFENINYTNKKVSCTYAPSVSNPCYTNANTHYYDYNSENNYGNSYLKTSSNTGNNNYYFDYDACSESRKNDGMASNSYGSSLDPYNRDKFASIITTKSTSVTQHNKPVNWMTAPSNIPSKDYLLPPFSTKDSSGMYNTSFPSSVVSSGYFNTVSSYNSGEIIGSDKKNLDIGLPNYNASFQKGQPEENQFSWSPSKIPPFLDPAHSFVSATLPTLVGDLALNTQPPYIESKLNREKTYKSNIRKTKLTFDNHNNQSNFLSVSQLVENKDQTPAKVASRRNSGNKNKNISPEKAKRVTKSEQNKIDKNTQIKVSQSQPSEQLKDVNKNVTSNYSAEALIGQPVQSYSKKSKTFVPNFMTDNFVTYFPPIDPQESNNFISQQSVYSSASFSHSFSNSLQNNTSTANSIMSNPPTTYLASSNFLNDHEFYDMYNPSIPVNKERPGTKDSTKGSLKSDKSLSSNCKKSKKRNLNEGVLPPFDIPFLSIPGSINSPLLPDDFHHTFLPPSNPYKNPLYPPKQNADIGALLPPLPTVTGTKSNVPNHDVSPSINTVGTSLTNFNLSTIFPEINKGPPPNHVNAPPQSFASSSSAQSTKPTFTFSTYSS